MNKALKMALLYFMVFASVLMIVALVITSIVQGASADVPAVMTQAQGDSGYWLRSYNGHIAVYDTAADSSPIIETTISVDGLRAVDKIALDSGIKADSYEDVLKRLEDFGS